MAAYIQQNADTPGSRRGSESAGKKAFEEGPADAGCGGGSGAGASCCRDGSPPQRPLPGIRRLTAGIDLDGRTRDGLLRTWLRLPHDFRMEPRVRREDREILLLSRMLTLNEQEAAWALASAD
jgi:hypothetical protein